MSRISSSQSFIFITIFLSLIFVNMTTSVGASENNDIRRFEKNVRSYEKMIERIRQRPSGKLVSPPGKIDGLNARSQYNDAIQSAARRFKIPPTLIAAVIKCESNWKSRAVSKVGARGLMQVLPSTAKGEFNIDPIRLWDPVVNIQVGTAYLRYLANRYKGDAATTVAAYNAGPGRIESGRSLPMETVRYSNCVRRWFRSYNGGR